MKCDSFFTTSARFMMWVCFVWIANFCAFAADLPQGLVLHYGFDQEPAANGVITDKSSLHNDGRVSGAKWIAAGKQGGAMEFAAAKAFITIANHGSLNPKMLTLAVWFKTAKSDMVTRQLIDKRAQRGYALSIAGDPKYPKSSGHLAFTINGYHLLSENVLTDGAWHHGVAVFDGKEMNLYVDGVLQKTTTPCSENIAANLDDLTIGMNKTNSKEQEREQRSFDGALDEIMIFNRALTSDEIKGLIGAADPALGKPKFTQKQVAGRLRELKRLYDEGLLTEKFYNKKVAECEATMEDDQAAATTKAPAKPTQ